ncbi:hypothetical protein NONO_c72210 [Nocardia nova SH22a]|uniref:Uncharacterized protein n=1 Tax=Nocardia nova SH22a TaxID=1415166 RepID=W5TSV2_9NOCA|nr:hypothetical protein [Nocardia nova]AHH21978.1 hypothetical protein NONO_c72210 [Nocardia nova SH22a]
MDADDPAFAMGYVCVDLVKTMTGVDFRARQVSARLGYQYLGLCRSSSLIVPAALLDHIATHQVELLIVPDLTHLRGRVPPELAELTDIHNLATGHTYERWGAYAPDEGRHPNPLTPR